MFAELVSSRCSVPAPFGIRNLVLYYVLKALPSIAKCPKSPLFGAYSAKIRSLSPKHPEPSHERDTNKPLGTLVPGAGFEPARSYDQRILSPQRLPFRHPGKG